jgi:hypothetical protein
MSRLGELLNSDRINFVQSFDAEDPIPVRFSSHFHIYKVYFLPTEVVVSEPRLVVPKEGRIYRVGLYLRDGIVFEYQELSKLPDFKGTYTEKELFFTEIYEDVGDDGHIRYNLNGYALMTKEQISEYIEKNRFKCPAKDFWGN